MKKIGLVGEDPNDTSAIRNLLSKANKFQQFQYIPLAKNQTGNQLDNPKTKRIIDFQIRQKDVKHIIFIRDLDGLENNFIQLKKRNEWFTQLNSEGIGIFLLNIYELEAIILSDIDNFNNLFKINISFPGDPMKQKDPKGYLKEKTRKHYRRYSENDAPEIFAQLDFETVKRNCRYFQNFIRDLEVKLFPKKSEHNHSSPLFLPSEGRDREE